MKQILMENAFEAWMVAIRFCNDIKSGKCTLRYQKSFVSSLHNAIELFLKQMMLNKNQHDVAWIRKKERTANAQLLHDYNTSQNLNGFFEKLSVKKIDIFESISFNQLIQQHKNIIGESLAPDDSFEDELLLLNKLRNEETHFAIQQGSYLSEENFRILHNFMIRFYRILDIWRPDNRDNPDLWLLPYCWTDPEDIETIYGFNIEPLNSFSYESAVRESALASKIAELLSSDILYGAPDFSSYSITKGLLESNPNLAQFNEVWALVQMMLHYEIIAVEEWLDDEQGKVHFALTVSL